MNYFEYKSKEFKTHGELVMFLNNAKIESSNIISIEFSGYTNNWYLIYEKN